jgi:hypothetical protein
LTDSNLNPQRNLLRAASSLRAVRLYAQDFREYGSERVYQYFDDVEGDPLEQFEDSSERGEGGFYPANLSEDVLKDS